MRRLCKADFDRQLFYLFYSQRVLSRSFFSPFGLWFPMAFLSSILSQPTKTNLDFEEATVISVDTSKYTAQVRTISGRRLTTATWITPLNTEDREADLMSPAVGTNVLVYMKLGRPLIFGCVPNASEYSTIGQNSITQTSSSSNTYPGVSGIPAPLGHNPGAPKDYMRGDRVLTSKGGAMLALLFGTVVVKASGMAQIILSKLDDIVKIIARNHELITDAATHVYTNFRGRIYDFFGTALTQSDQVNSRYGYYRIHGDVAAGEALKENSYGQPASAAPTATSYIMKEVVCTWGSGTPVVMATSTYDGLTGTYYRQVSGPTATLPTMTLSHTNNTWSLQLSSPAAQITLSPNSIYAEFGSSSTLTMNATETQATFSGSQMTLTSASAVLSSNGHAVTVNSSGVHTS